MSYEIFYDRAFIRVNELYIPLANHGSSNCWGVSFNGREIAEKSWQVLNWRDRTRLLYTEAEVREIARDYENISQESGTCYKSRNRQFEPGEFERWILCGLKSAFTIEEYVAAGNQLRIHDYSADEIKDWKKYSFSTTEQFLTLIDMLKGCTLLNVHFDDNREVYRPKKHQDYNRRQEYYVLCSAAPDSKDLFFCKLARRGYYISQNLQNGNVRTFATEKAANKYLKKYENRLAQFEAKKIQEMEQAS